jgi:hypothetical protein
MRMMRSALVLAALVFVALPAKAGLLIEPYVSYDMGKLTYKSGGSTDELDFSGVGFGARFAYTLPMLMLGVDYTTASGKFKEGSAEVDGGRSGLFAIVGARIPFFRAWVGYGFMNDATWKTTPEVKLLGTALKVGGSYTGLPLVALNAEYIMSNYTRARVGSVEADLASGDDAKMNTLLFSLSVPFNL